MKKDLTIALLAAALLGINAHAQITVSNFEMTTNSIAFDISGTMPDTTDLSDYNLPYIFLELHPIWTTQSPIDFSAYLSASTLSFSGSQTLDSVSIDPRVEIVEIGFTQPLSTNEVINGRLVATFPGNPFTPEHAQVFTLFWGYPDDAGDNPEFLATVNMANVNIPDELYFTYSFEEDSNGNLRFNFIVDAPPTGEDYDLEVSTNLVDWQRIDGYLADGEPEYNVYTVPSGSNRAFYRWVKATD